MTISKTAETLLQRQAKQIAAEHDRWIRYAGGRDHAKFLLDSLTQRSDDYRGGDRSVIREPEDDCA